MERLKLKYSEGGKRVCERLDCAMWCDAIKGRLVNQCKGLTEVPFDTRSCPFFKTREEMHAYEKQRRERMKVDEPYRALCESYGIFLRGRKEK